MTYDPNNLDLVSYRRSSQPLLSHGKTPDEVERSHRNLHTYLGEEFRKIETTTSTLTSAAKDFHTKLSETVSVKDFGAVGDGVTDDTSAIQAAINYARSISAPLVCATGSTYLIKNLTVDAIEMHANASLFIPVANSDFCIKLTGFRPSLADARFSDTSSNVVRVSQLASSAISGATSFTLINSSHGMKVGQAFWLLQDDGLPFMSRISGIAGAVITVEAPTFGSIASGRSCRASFGQVYVNNSMFFDINNVQLIGASAGIWIDGNDGDTGKGTVRMLRGFTYKHFGVGIARGAHEVTVENYFLRGGFNDVTTATGNGSSVNFSIPNEARMKREVSVKVNNVLKAYGTDYTITANGPSGGTITFVSAPANGAIIEITNYAFSEFGIWTDSTGWNVIRGGSRFGKGVTIHHRVGRFVRARELEEHNNNQDDTCSYRATWVTDCGRDIWFDNHYAGYAYEPIYVKDSIGVNFGGRLATWITPSAEWSTVTSQPYAVSGVGSTTRVIIDPWGWSVASDKAIFGAGATVYTEVRGNSVVAGTSSMPFSNGWVNSTSSNTGPVIATKTATNRVYLEGGIISGSVGYLTTILTLPPGYRPGRVVSFPVNANGAVAFVRIDLDGTVKQDFGPDLSPSYTSLSGISFDVA